MSASKRVSGEPFGVYMGNTTRCSMPSLLESSGRNRASEAAKSGLPTTLVQPVPQVDRAPGRDRRAGAESAGPARRSPRPWLATWAPTATSSWRSRSTSPLGSCSRRRASVASRRRVQAGSAAAAETDRLGRRAERRQSDPVEQIEPELAVIELAERDRRRTDRSRRPPPRGPRRGSPRPAGRRRRVRRRRRRAARSRRRPRPAKRRPGRSRRRARGAAAPAHRRPCRARRRPSSARHCGARDPRPARSRSQDRTRARSSLEVGAVLVFLGLAQHDQAAAARRRRRSIASISGAESTGEPPTVRSQRGSEGWAMTSTSASASAAADSGPAVRAATSKSRSARRAGGQGVRRPRGMLGLHRRGGLGAHAPRLAVGFIEQHASDLALTQGSDHGEPPCGGPSKYRADS